MIYALATVKRGTSHDEIADLVDGFFLHRPLTL